MSDTRLLPCDFTAEMSLICTFIITDDPALRADLSASVMASDFLSPDNGTLWQAAVDLWTAGAGLSTLSLREHLVRRGKWEDVGGDGYITKVFRAMPSQEEIHAQTYRSIVADLSARRQLISIMAKADEKARMPGAASGEEIIVDTVDRLSAVLQRDASAKSQHVSELVVKVMEDIETPKHGRFVALGYREFNRDYGGLLPGESVVVAGKPSMGKSTLARCVAMNIGRAGVPGGYFSLEESASKVAQNMIAAMASVENEALRKRSVTPDEKARIVQAQSTFARMPVYITDRCRTWPQIRAEAIRMIARHGIRFMVLDYLQLLSGFGKADGDEYARVSAASMAVTQFNKEHNLVGIIVAQPNRQNDKRDNKRLNMSDLRGSGQIEQDADAILFLHREDYYRANDTSRSSEPYDQVAEVYVAKWRDGARGRTINLTSELRYQRFIDPPEDQQEFYP